MIRLAFLCGLIAVAGVLPVRAGHKVLMIGVMNYTDDLTRRFGTLSGPGPDVALMARVFADLGVAPEQITVLTDAPELITTPGITPARPDRRTILSRLDQLARTAQPGDAITIYVAGHGAQLPATGKEDEADGFDEVFLPSDFRVEPDGTPVNMVLDDEIGARVTQMIAAGANVWLIADTCHAGSLRRGDPFGLVPRYVDLNLDPAATTSDAQLVDLQTPGTGAAGQFTGFYAAAAGALAYETRIPGSQTNHGLLTWALAGALRDGQASTYSDLARRTTATLWTLGQGRAEPQFEGALGAPQVFSDPDGVPDGFAIAVGDQITLSAGRVDGIEPGTVFAIHGPGDAPLFEVTATGVSLTQSVAALPADDLPILDEVLISEGLDPARFRLRWLKDRAPALTARIAARPADLSVSVGLAASGISSDLSAGIAQIVSDLSPRLRLEMHDPDLHIVARRGVLTLQPAPTDAPQLLSVPAEPAALPRLKDLLRQAVKARGLLRVGEALQSTKLSQHLNVGLRRSRGARKADGSCQASPADGTRPVTVPHVSHCDTVTIDVENRNPWPVDLTPLYIAPDNQVYFLSGYRDAARGGWRIMPGGADTLSYVEATETPDGTPLATGQMHIVLLAERGRPDAVPVDFRYLQSRSPPPETRSADPGSLTALLREAGFGLSERRFAGATVIGQSGAVVLPLRTVAQEGANHIAE